MRFEVRDCGDCILFVHTERGQWINSDTYVEIERNIIDPDKMTPSKRKERKRLVDKHGAAVSDAYIEIFGHRVPPKQWHDHLQEAIVGVFPDIEEAEPNKDEVAIKTLEGVVVFSNHYSEFEMLFNLDHGSMR